MDDSSQRRPDAAELSLPPDLIEKVEQGRYVLFVGSGASQPEPGYVGPPGPAILASELIQRLGFAPVGATLPRVAEAYKDRTSSQELADYVARRYDDPRYRPTQTQHLVAQMQPGVIVSTAYDELLDGLLRRQPGRRVVLRNDDVPGVSHPQLIKLLGTASQPATLRLTQQDRWTIFEDLRDVEATVRTLARDHPLLFIGMHPEDSSFRDLFAEFLYRLHEQQTAPVSYLVHSQPSADELDYWRRRRLVILDAEPQVFLLALQGELARRRGAPPPQPPEAILPARLSEQEAQRLDVLLQQVLALMGLGDPVADEASLLRFSVNREFVHQLQAEYAQSGRLDAQAVAGDPAAARAQAQVRVQLGYAEWVQRNYGQARKYLEEAQALDPSLASATLGLHYVLAESGDWAGALAAYQQLSALHPGQALLPQRYTVNSVLGYGDLGITYNARDHVDEQPVAITMLRSGLARDPEALRSFAESASRLQHHAIPRLLRIEHILGRHAIVREFVAGKSLARTIDGDPMPPSQAFALLDQLAAALEFAHGQGVPHLHLSPHSVLRTAEGDVRVIHFGDARLLAASSGAAALGQDLDFVAPEQRAGAPGDAASDIYALGTLAFRLFTGLTPSTVTYGRPSELNPAVDEAVDVLVAQARAIDPAQRFADVGQMRQELQRIAAADHPGGFSQTVRWMLSRVSQGMQGLLLTPTRRLTLLALVLAALSAELWLDWAPGRAVTRLLVLLAVTCLPAGFVCDWRVRDIARRMGYGSLIHSGRGMGAVLGALATIWLMTVLTVFGEPMGIGEPTPLQFFTAYLVTPMLVFAVIYLMLATTHGLGQLSEQRWRRYTVGFYAGFLLWCLLFVLLIVLQVPSPMDLQN